MAKTKNAVGENLPPMSPESPPAATYTLPRSPIAEDIARKRRRAELLVKRDRQQLAANIVNACLEALDRPQLFTAEQLLLLDQLYESASGLESLV